MIREVNYLTGYTIRIAALIKLKTSQSYRNKFTIIKNKLVEVNKKKKKLPKQLIDSIVIIEDRRYFQHLGIDFYSIIRAVYKNITTNRIEGASTIVQQLVRNTIEEREIRIKRKVNEIMLATLINKEFTKEEILYAYLDTYKFVNYIGVFNFCLKENYNINKLSFNETAEIAARIKYPLITKSNYIKYLKRVRTIQKTMNN